MRLIHLLSHVVSSEVSDSQLVGLGRKELNSLRTMLGILIESTNLFFFFLFLIFFSIFCFFSPFFSIGGAH